MKAAFKKDLLKSDKNKKTCKSLKLGPQESSTLARKGLTVRSRTVQQDRV